MTGLSPWKSLEAHLAWADGPWLGFVFADDVCSVHTLAARSAQQVPGARTVCPQTPQQLREGVPRLLEGPSGPLTWVIVDGSASGPWQEAADWFLLRANERRQPLLAHLDGGLLIALPTAHRPRVAEAAPDLWSIRALVLDLPTTPAPIPRPPPLSRRIDGLIRRLGFQQRMRTDPWHARVRVQVAEDRSLVRTHLEASLPSLTVRSDGPDQLWVGVPPGEDTPSLVVDLDQPLPPDHLPSVGLPESLADPLADVDDTLRTAAATWSQGWASETLELCDRVLDDLGGAPSPDDDRRRAAALELAARARRELGDPIGALDALQHAEGLRRHLAVLPGDDLPRRERELARVLSLRGQLLLEGADPDAAWSDLQEALSLRLELARWSDDPESSAELALSHSLLADAALSRGADRDALRAAEASCRQALALRRRVVDGVPALRHRRQLGLAWGRLGRVLARQLHLREAERAWDEAVRLAAEVAAASELPVHRMEESVARTQLAAVRWSLGDRKGSGQEVSRAIAQRRALLAADPANARWAERLAVALGQGAQQALDEGELADALALAKDAVRVGEGLAPSTGQQLRGLALAHIRLGDVHAAAGRGSDASAAWSRARALLPALHGLPSGRADELEAALALRA